MKNLEVIFMYREFNNLSQDPSIQRWIKVFYWVKKNLILLKPFVKDIETMINSIRAETGEVSIKEYDEKRLELCVSFSKKDVNGNPVIINGQFDIDPERKSELEKAMEALNLLYPEEIKALQSAFIKVQEYEQSESELIEFYKIKLSDIPETVAFNSQQMDLFIDLIIDDSEN